MSKSALVSKKCDDIRFLKIKEHENEKITRFTILRILNYIYTTERLYNFFLIFSLKDDYECV